MKKILLLITVLTFQNIYAQKSAELYKKGAVNSFYQRQTRDISLMDGYDVKFYFLNLKMENTSTAVNGSVTCKALVKANQLDTFAFELLSGLTIDSVLIDGSKVNVVRNGNVSYAICSTPIPQGQLFESVVYYHGTPSSSGFFSGISSQQSQTWKCRATWTLSEPFNAYQWWPCKQELTDKIDSSWVFITTTYPNMAGSNGVLENIVDLGNGKRRFEWKSRTPIVYYLISVAISKYKDYSFKVAIPGIADSVLVQNFVYDTTVYNIQLGGNVNCLQYFKTEIDRTAEFLKLYSDKYGPYPFAHEKYGHCMAPLGGGMEHQTMTTLGTFNFYLVCHELAHQWFGNNVTCADWRDIWVNEGFADYSEYVAAQYLATAQDAAALMNDKHTNIMSEPDGSIYIPLTEPLTEARIFDSRLSYNKGGAFLHMLRYETNNDSLFWAAFKTYQNQFADSVAVGLDFKNVLETVTGIDFTDMFNQWYFGEGYPTYSAVWAWANDTLNLKITHTTSTTTTPTFKGHLDIKLNSAAGDTIIRLYIQSNNTSFKIYMPRQITGIAIDPLNWIVNKVGSVSVGTPEDFQYGTDFVIAPNPANDIVTIMLSKNSNNYSIKIFDLAGKVCHSESGLSVLQKNIDIRHLASGMYWIEISANGYRSTKKFFKE